MPIADYIKAGTIRLLRPKNGCLVCRAIDYLGSIVLNRRIPETDFSCGLDSVGPGCDLRIADAIANPQSYFVAAFLDQASIATPAAIIGSDSHWPMLIV